MTSNGSLIMGPLIMGIVNVTPDSFSDGGRFLAPEKAIAHGQALLAQGADILDIGGESTRPGATPVGTSEEIDRVVPVIAALRALTDQPISIDTRTAMVAEAACAAGASLWNDITALTGSPHSLEAAARLGCGVVLMHMQGNPETMQLAPRYDDVVAEVTDFLDVRARAARAAGITQQKIWLDPGIGFGKTLAHNLALLRNLCCIVKLGYPVLVGASRKSFIARIAGSQPSDPDRLGGSLAAAIAAARAGAQIIRTHDVAQTRQALAMDAAIAQVPAHG